MSYVRMCVVSVANVSLPVPPMARLTEQEEGFLHSRVFMLYVWVWFSGSTVDIKWEHKCE